ncbi:enoyl-CoA hydratase/isomerase family protein [Nocardia sp. X0981]
MTYETLLVDIRDGVATVTLNRPEVRNAIDERVQRDLRSALERLSDDDAVGAVVFTGAGDRAFAAGADIGQLRDYTLHTGLAARMQRLYDDIEAFDKPTLAAVNGYALGGGCELAMSCDIRIAAEKAVFGLPETQLAVLPGAGGTQRLARLVGAGRAIELILTGRTVAATEAAEIGLVTAVVPDPVAHARETAQRVLARGPLAVRLAKLVIRTGMDAGQRTGLVVERLAQALLYTSDDKTEGAAAFLEKRPPRFTGH